MDGDVEHQPAEFSGEALELLGLYRELLAFKDERGFHRYCYAQGSPYRGWVARVEELGDRSGAELIGETGILPGDLWQLGSDYCQNTGQETEYTRWLKSHMDVRWLATG